MAFSLGSRSGITRGFIGIGHGLCQIQGRCATRKAHIMSGYVEGGPMVT